MSILLNDLHFFFREKKGHKNKSEQQQSVVKHMSSERVVDFRSDTLTLPSDDMRLAMAHAIVGDDVFAEDPTIISLESEVATWVGKEKGLFVPTGTMGNLICQMIHASGLFSEIIVGDCSHIALFEVGGGAIVGRANIRQVPNADDGTIPLDVLRRAIRPKNVHYPTTRAICLENTHNAKGGKVLPLDYIAQVRSLCDEHGISLHLDGARVWNAATALQVPPKDILKYFDTASLCLSKALGAPVGSVIVGSKIFIDDARRARKMLGGGMRQAGIVAAGGLYAVKHMYNRLSEDHDMARELARLLSALGLVVVPPESNIVIWQIEPAKCARFVELCGSKGLKVVIMAEGRIRAIPHYGNTMDDVRLAVTKIEEVLKEL